MSSSASETGRRPSTVSSRRPCARRAGAARLARGATGDAALGHRQGEQPIIRQIFIGRERTSRTSRFRAQAVRDPQAAGEEVSRSAIRPQLLLCQQPELQDLVYKGCSRRPAAPLLSRPGRPSVVSAIAMVHQRFSTNTSLVARATVPLHLAQREINTLRGNINGCMRAGDDALEALRQGSDEDPHGGRHHRSDSAMFDNVSSCSRWPAASCARDDDDGARALVARRHHGTERKPSTSSTPA